MSKAYHIKCLLWELDPDGYHLVIKGKIENYPVYLLIDTGANHSCFDQTFITEIQQDGKIIGKDEKNIGIGGDRFETVIVELNGLKIGRLSIPNYTVRLLDLQQVSDMYEQVGFKRIQGIIGGDFLKSHHAIIDYHNLILTLSINE